MSISLTRELSAIDADIKRLGARLQATGSPRSRHVGRQLSLLRRRICTFLARHADTIPEEMSAYFEVAVAEIDSVRDRRSLPSGGS